MLTTNIRSIHIILLSSMLIASCSKPTDLVNIPKEEVVLTEKLKTEVAEVEVNNATDDTARKNVIIQEVKKINYSTLGKFQGKGEEYHPTLQELDSVRLQPSSALRKRSLEPTVYFKFNESLISQPRRLALQAHIDFLKKNKRVKVILEGHTDERGTSQYNLSLGLQRSITIKNHLLENDIAPKRIEVRTFGEERPVLTGHQETHWRYNRRVEIYYQQ